MRSLSQPYGIDPRIPTMPGGARRGLPPITQTSHAPRTKRSASRIKGEGRILLKRGSPNKAASPYKAVSRYKAVMLLSFVLSSVS